MTTEANNAAPVEPVDEMAAFEVTNSEADALNQPNDESGDDTAQNESGDDAASAESKDGEKPKTGETDDEKKRSDASEEEANRKGGRRFQKRIDRLTKRAAEAERRAEEAERRANELEQKSKPAPAATADEPDPADFDDYDEYLTAFTDWKAASKAKPSSKEAAKEPKPKAKPDDKAPADDQEFADALEDVQEAFEDWRKKHDDFDEVVTHPDVQITRDMVLAMAESDDPGGIAYHLGKNREEAARIAALSPIAQAREIGKIEATLAAPKPAPTKKTTQAPDPIDPVRGASSASKEPADMSFKEYEQAMNERESKGGRGFW